MGRSEGKVNRAAAWTAWDAKTRVYRRSASFRKILRRLVKRQDRQAQKKTMEEREAYEPPATP